MKIYFKCTLESDIVINASLATEGNMKTLDYIPGSNFLGIAAKNYKQWKKDDLAYDIFHSGNISFGDAHLTKDGSMSYAMPFSLFTDKLATEVAGPNAKVLVHHILQRYLDGKDSNIQLKQYRKGYLNPNKEFIPKVEKRFALKSAQDRTSRKSLDSAMFGFQSMKAGQTFIFSLDIKEGILSKENIKKLTESLEGGQRIGKSKSAQYGQVTIKEISVPDIFPNEDCQGNCLLIYAESNLCFYNEYGQPIFQPTPSDFGLADLGEFDWVESQIRTYSYSPWNFHRNTTDPQRDCIQKGSVLVFKFDDPTQARNPNDSQVGAFQSEGLGCVIYNPTFLSANDEGRWTFELIKPKPKPSNHLKITDKKEENYGSDLGKFLLKKYKRSERELAIGKAVLNFINGTTDKGKLHTSIFENIPTSQWGQIRAKAFKAKNNIDLIDDLFGEKGMLTTGVAADRYWNKKGGLARVTLQKTIQDNTLENTYVIKLATEMAKWKQQFDKDNDKSKKQKTINA